MVKKGKYMNQFISQLIDRRSIRNFNPDMVPDEDINDILEAGLYAATGMNNQKLRLIAITDKNVRNEISQMNAKIMGKDMDPFYGAPVIIIALADKSAGTYIYDGSLALGNMMNAASSLGLGSCWIHRAKEEFESPEGKDLLKKWGLEGDFEGIGHLAVGYAANPEDMKAERLERKAGRIVRI